MQIGTMVQYLSPSRAEVLAALVLNVRSDGSVRLYVWHPSGPAVEEGVHHVSVAAAGEPCYRLVTEAG